MRGGKNKKRTISLSSYSAGTDFLDLIFSYINGWVNAGSSNSLWPLVSVCSVGSTISCRRDVPTAVHEKVDYHILAEVLPILECNVNSASDVCREW